MVYQVYANVLGLGGIDGLTPLPEAYWPPDSKQVQKDWTPLRPRPNLAILKLKQAFGEGSPELARIIKLDMPSKGLVLAVDDFEIMPEPNNDRVKLVPFSLAIIKAPAAGRFPEINTIRCKEAYLQLDQPIKSYVELGKCKIIGGELRNDVQLVNNRGTSQRTDDLEMYTNGRVYYEEKQHLIWTPDTVRLSDLQTRPEPTTIDAVGMDVHLAADLVNPPPAATAPKPKGERPPDVERIELRSNVRMNHWVEGGAGFLASGKSPAKSPPAPAGKPERAKLVITTDGKFCYDLKTNRATFDIPHRPSRHPEIVRVVRQPENAPDKWDQLDCDHLTLQFRRKPDGDKDPSNPANPPDRTSPNLEIESAHATGKALVLTS